MLSNQSGDVTWYNSRMNPNVCDCEQSKTAKVLRNQAGPADGGGAEERDALDRLNGM
jgi:hypothetical protein